MGEKKAGRTARTQLGSKQFLSHSALTESGVEQLFGTAGDVFQGTAALSM